MAICGILGDSRMLSELVKRKVSIFFFPAESLTYSASRDQTLAGFVTKTQRGRRRATGSDVMWSLYKARPASPLRPPLSCRARHAAVCSQSLRVDGGGSGGGSCPGGLVDQCAMITAGQLAVFPFASLILAFFFPSKHYHHAAPLLCAQCLRAKWQWPALRCGFEVIYTVESSGRLLWAAMSLTKKLAPWFSFLFLLPDTNTPLFVTRICCGACKLPHSWCVYCPSLCTPAYLCWVYSAFPVAAHKQPPKCCKVHKSLWSKHTQKRMHGKWDKH